MLNTDVMKYVLMGILLLCGYVFLLHSISGRLSTKKSMPALSIVLFVIYAVLAVPLMIILNQMGSSSFVLLALLMLLSCFVLFTLIYGLIRDFSELNRSMLVLFVLYVLAVSYFTIFNREEGHSRAILLRFDSLQEAIRSGSLEPLQHVWLNVVMFIPIGILFPLVRPSRLSNIFYVGTLGLMMSTIIETTQMFLKIGQCDVEDIIANTLGAIIGVVLFKAYARFFRRNDDDEEDEDEDYEDDEEEEAE